MSAATAAARVSGTIKHAAKAAREVFDGQCSSAMEAIDYMEQLLLAAIQPDPEPQGRQAQSATEQRDGERDDASMGQGSQHAEDREAGGSARRRPRHPRAASSAACR